MSHLIHILEYKKALTEKGITCPIEQSKLLAEPFARALIRRSYRLGGWTSEMDARAWAMLEKWNSVSPIPAALIHQQAQWRINNLNGWMMKHGTIPPYMDYTTLVEVNGSKVDVSDCDGFSTLVDYLVKELEANRE